MLNILNNFLNTNINKRNFIEVYTLPTYLRFYRCFYNLFNLNFFKYSEFFFILKRFNSNDSISFTTLFTFIINSNKTFNTDTKYFSVLNNNSLIYFFNHTTVFLKKIVLTLKTNFKVSIYNLSQHNYIIRYSSTSVVKYLHNNYLSLLNVLFLRKNKIFNKGRYSRNRQFYRTGVYWCLYINIIAMVGLYFWFYRFVMNFGYLWWLFYLSLASFLVAKSFNFNLLNINNFTNSIRLDLVFFSLLLVNIYNFVKTIILTLVVKLTRLNFVNLSIINQYGEFLSWFFLGFLHFFNKTPYTYIWGYENINYYIYSITLNYNRVWLNSKKHKLFSEFINMLIIK